MDLTVTAVLLGIVEGLTEFIPVSSTGHLILAAEIFGYDADQWKVFNVVIQLGAILAVVVQYWRTFWAVGWGLLRLTGDPPGSGNDPGIFHALDRGAQAQAGLAEDHRDDG